MGSVEGFLRDFLDVDLIEGVAVSALFKNGKNLKNLQNRTNRKFSNVALFSCVSAWFPLVSDGPMVRDLCN